MKIGVGCIWNDVEILKSNLLQSPGMFDSGASLFHVQSPKSAASGLNKIINGMESEKFELAVMAHQDVLFPEGWFFRLYNCLEGLPATWFVAGVWGLRKEGSHKVHYGNIAEGRWLDRSDRYLVVGTKSLPARVQALDECCLIFRLCEGFRFDESYEGFDLYGSEICLWAQSKGYSAWAINNFVVHNTKRSWDWSPDEKFKARVHGLETEYKTEVLSTVI